MTLSNEVAMSGPTYLDTVIQPKLDKEYIVKSFICVSSIME